MSNNEKDHIEQMLEDEELQTEQAPVVEEVSETEKLKRELADLKDKYLRHIADTENYTKRLVRETDEKIKYANQSLISMFLPVLDNFDLALQHIDGVTVETVIEGIVLNQRVMLDSLAKAGLVKIDVQPGEPFNPEVHEAIALCNNPELENNVISIVIQNGYKMGDRIIRSAKVQVNKK